MKKVLLILLLFSITVKYISSENLREEVCLNGEWVFAGGGPRETEPVPSSDIGWTTIRVPGSWYYRPFNYTASDWSNYHYGWYKLPLTIPSRWSGKRIKIYFERVNHYACIFINDKKVGEHQESFTPFEVDITTFVTLGGQDTLYIYNEDSWRSAYPTPGSAPALASPTGLMSDYNTYTVAVGDYMMRNGNYNEMYSGIYSGFGDWEKGIWGNVYLKAYNPVYIEDVFIITSVRTKKITAKLYIKNEDSVNHTINIINTVVKDSQLKLTIDEDVKEVSNPDTTSESRTSTALPLTINANSRKCIEVSKQPWDTNWTNADGPKLWGIGKAKIKNGSGGYDYIDYGDPILYFLKTLIEENGQTIDMKHTRFGFREIWAYDPEDIADTYSYPYGKYDYHFYLNGKRIFFQATCLDHAHESFCYNRQNIIVLYRAEMGRNCNFIRLHCFSPPAIWFDVADELGVLVVPESHSRNNANSPSIYCKSQNSYTAFSVTLPQDQAVTDATANWIVNMKKYYSDYTKAHRNHPSIAMWSNGNEIFQKEQIYNNNSQKAARQGRTETFLQFGRESIKPADPTRIISTSGVSRFIKFDSATGKCTFDDTIVPEYSDEIEVVDIRKIFVYEAPERMAWEFTADQAFNNWQINFKRPVMNTEEELDVVPMDFIDIANPTYGINGTVYNGYMALANFFYIDTSTRTRFTYVSPQRTYTNIGNAITRAAYYQIPRFNIFGVPIRDAWFDDNEVVFGDSHSNPIITWPSLSGDGVKAKRLISGSSRTTYNWFDSSKALYRTNFLFDRIKEGWENNPPYGAMPKFYESGWYEDSAFTNGLIRIPEVVVTLKNNGAVMSDEYIYIEPNQEQSIPLIGVKTDSSGKAWFTLNQDGAYKLVYYSGGNTYKQSFTASYTYYKNWTTGGYSYIQTVDFDIANLPTPDVTSPARVTDLVIISKLSNSVTLGWTATGDDGNTYTANSYDVRYQTYAITADNWNNATQSTGEPLPKSAGNSETFRIYNLSADTTYYFAIKVGDEIPNYSEISDIVNAKTSIATIQENALPKPVNYLTTTQLNNNSIELSWLASVSSTVVNYNIYMTTGTAMNYAVPCYIVSSTASVFTIINLIANQEYKFVVRAADINGNEDSNTNIVAETAIEVAANIPQMKLTTISNGFKISGTNILLLAENFTQDTTNITEVVFEYKKLNETTWTKISTDTSRPYYILWDVSGLEDNQQYNIRAASIGEDGTHGSNSSNGGYITVTIDNEDPDILEGNNYKYERIDNRRLNIVKIVDTTTNLISAVKISTGVLTNGTTDILKITINPSNYPSIDNNLNLIGYIHKIEMESGQKEFSENIEISLPYSDVNNDNRTDEKDIIDTKLVVCTNNGMSSNWEQLMTTELDKTNKVLITKTKHLSFYGIFAVIQSNFEGTHIYPNPFKPSIGHTKIFFTNLTTHTKIMIFNTAGELVYEEEKDTPTGELSWNVKNNEGKKIASGVYIYLITNDHGHTKRGKLAIVR